jgi:RNA polymerase sigma factor (sigma-70 family)
VNADAVLRELEGMRALARALVHDSAHADDLLQDAAVAALEKPPTHDDVPPRAWLVGVLRNRRRMDTRAAARRAARELRVGPIVDETERPDAALDRARAFERLGAALTALDEPFRTTVIRRYLDGQSAAEISKALAVPAGTVRWRLTEGLARLRAALDRSEPRWQRAFVPLAGAGVVKSKTGILVALVVLLLLGAGAVVVVKLRGDAKKADPIAKVVPRTGSAPNVAPVVPGASDAPAPDPLPGQGRVIVDRGPGLVAGRVINWSTGDGVEGADITFTSGGAATTVRTRTGGAFELAPPAPGRFLLSTIAAPGFLPYAPELLHSTVHVEVLEGRQVRGLTVFLFPALDYYGRVVDAKGAAVPGAKVRLLGTPTNEQAIDKLETEWTTDKAGKFVFHAADEAVFEATRGKERGWARLDGVVMNTKRLTITIAAAPARDRTISGRVMNEAKQGIPNVLVRAEPQEPPGPQHTRSTSFTTTSADGSFTLTDLDDRAYVLGTEAEGFPPASVVPVLGGARDVSIILVEGKAIAGKVVNGAGDPVGAYTLLVFRKRGVAREIVIARSIADASGKFEIRVDEGEYDVQASASGWAPSPYVVAKAGDRDVVMKVSEGATLRGQVLAADGSGPIPYTRIMREARSGGASAQPANAGTVTRADGTFELTGIPPGPVSITIGAGGFHPKIEAGMTASDGGQIGPVTITLVKLKEGEQPQTELIGIGVKLVGVEDGLLVEAAIPNGGAEAAGIVAGDTVVAVDGIAVSKLGLDGAIAKIRGVEGTTVAITVLRGGKPVPIVVTRKKLRA